MLGSAISRCRALYTRNMPNQSTKILGITGLTSRCARLPNRRRTAWRSGWAGEARPRMWWRCWRRSPSTLRRHLSGPITGTNSSLKLYGAGARPAAPPARLTSSQDPRGRTSLLSRSMAGCGMNSSTLSCSPQLRKRRSWPIAGVGSIYAQATLGTPRAYAPGSSSTGSCRMTTPTHSHKPWTNKGGHVMWRHSQAAGCHSLRLLRSSRQDGPQTAKEGRQ